mmetsp:Transcript_19220/g.31712  ORF Transcript_19220/g.31712 Transcript_19220/m.31712 type:complete len:491 (+) Transcript_19220:199-1671(+)
MLLAKHQEKVNRRLKYPRRFNSIRANPRGGGGSRGQDHDYQSSSSRNDALAGIRANPRGGGGWRGQDHDYQSSSSRNDALAGIRANPRGGRGWRGGKAERKYTSYDSQEDRKSAEILQSLEYSRGVEDPSNMHSQYPPESSTGEEWPSQRPQKPTSQELIDEYFKNSYQYDVGSLSEPLKQFIRIEAKILSIESENDLEQGRNIRIVADNYVRLMGWDWQKDWAKLEPIFKSHMKKGDYEGEIQLTKKEKAHKQHSKKVSLFSGGRIILASRMYGDQDRDELFRILSHSNRSLFKIWIRMIQDYTRKKEKFEHAIQYSSRKHRKRLRTDQMTYREDLCRIHGNSEDNKKKVDHAAHSYYMQSCRSLYGAIIRPRNKRLFSSAKEAVNMARGVDKRTPVKSVVNSLTRLGHDSGVLFNQFCEAKAKAEISKEIAKAKEGSISPERKLEIKREAKSKLSKLWKDSGFMHISDDPQVQAQAFFLRDCELCGDI